MQLFSARVLLRATPRWLMLTCPSPPPLMILLQSLVPAMAVTPILCTSWMTSVRRPLSGANTRILPSFQAERELMLQSHSNNHVITLKASRWLWCLPLMMLWPSDMKSSEVQVMLGTVMRSSSLGRSTCHTLMSSSEHVANNSEVPLEGEQIIDWATWRNQDHFFFSFLSTEVWPWQNSILHFTVMWPSPSWTLQGTFYTFLIEMYVLFSSAS